MAMRRGLAVALRTAIDRAEKMPCLARPLTRE